MNHVAHVSAGAKIPLGVDYTKQVRVVKITALPFVTRDRGRERIYAVKEDSTTGNAREQVETSVWTSAADKNRARQTRPRRILSTRENVSAVVFTHMHAYKCMCGWSRGSI